MAKPVVLVVDDEADSLRALTQELESRYGAHYRIVARASATDALATLAELRAEDAAVPLVLADQWMPETTGIELLARTRELHPTARRGLLISWGDRSATAPILAAAALGQIEFYLPKPSWSPDEEFHLALTASLGEWWRQRGGRFEAVTVIGGEHRAGRRTAAGTPTNSPTSALLPCLKSPTTRTRAPVSASRSRAARAMPRGSGRP